MIRAMTNWSMRLCWTVALGLLGVAGCSKGPDRVTAESDARPAEATTESSSMAASNANAPQTKGVQGQPADDQSASAETASEPQMDYGDWLRLPDGMERRYRDVYPSLVRSAQAGDTGGLMNLAMASQQIGTVLARNGDTELAYQFIEQAGRALRAGLPAGRELLPDDTIATIFFNEACALSRSGQTQPALAAIDDAVAHGFTYLSAISSDDDLAAVRESEGFEQHMQQWEAAVKESHRAQALKDLQSGESFAFELTGTDITGKPVSLEALSGKVVIVDIWGTWCPPCRAEIPSFIKLQETYGDQGFQMVGLNYERKSTAEENLAAVVEFVDEMGINYPCILGERETLVQVPSFSGYPTTLFFDKSGKVRLKAVGLHDYHYLEAVVTTLLAE